MKAGSQPKNLPASVQARLINKARSERAEAQGIYRDYLIERWLYRLSQSPFADQFVLKGALLFSLWLDKPHRPTHDLDLLGFGSPDLKTLIEIVREICLVNVKPDGAHYLTETIQSRFIREDAIYHGVRVTFQGRVDTAIALIQVDIGFGDKVAPEPMRLEFPTILDFPHPILRAYFPETVVAEKLEALVMLDETNSRLKDYYDLWVLSKSLEFNGELLFQAIHTTFTRCQTPYPADVPVGLSNAFAESPVSRCNGKLFCVKKSSFIKKQNGSK